MTEAQVIALVASIAVASFTGLATIVVWMVRHNWARMEVGLDRERDARLEALKTEREFWSAQFREERDTRERELKSERDARALDRHDLRDEIAAQSNSLHAYKLEVAEKYVNQDRLAQALRPMEAGIARLEETIEKLFGELKGKQDKLAAH